MKKYPYWFLNLILSALAISACASSAKQSTALPTQSQDCQFSNEWEIEFVLSGGIAGQAKSLNISSNGNAILQDLRKGETRESKISQNELRQIEEMLVQACPFEGKGTGNECADCFEYQLNVSMNGRKYSLKVNEINIPEKAIPLFEYLASYLTK
jgi:hypothetical protein